MGNGSGKFGSSTTAEEIAVDAIQSNGGQDFNGKTFVVTGSTSGIGQETAKVLANHGGFVVVAGRNREAGEKVVKEIVDETKSPDNVTFLELDLQSLKSVKAFAEEYNKKVDRPIDVLINNAGVMAIPEFKETEDGIEMQFGTNHIGHFYLTQLLMDRIKAAPAPRIVNLSSAAHQMCPSGTDWSKMPPTRESYGAWNNYGLSKAANILFSVELDRRFKESEDSKHITAYSVHPGVIQTNLSRHMFGASVFNFVGGVFMKSIPQGAATTLYCAVHPDVLPNTGGYFQDCNVATPTKLSSDPDNAKKLWDASEAIVSAKAK